jgi:phytoene synthase
MAADDRHVADIVRQGDPDRHISVLYAPEDRRPALFALYAFDIEVARVRDLVREPLPGEIRLQWWRDAIAAAAPTGHPVADALNDAIERWSWPRAAFERLLEARIFDLYDDPMPDRATLEGYCGETNSTMVQLAALALDGDAAISHAATAGHAGCAQAIAGLLRALPAHRARGQCYVPGDVLAAAGTNRDAFVSGSDEEAAKRAVAAMIALGCEHAEAFERGARALPAALRPAFLPAALARARLDRIAAAPLVGGHGLSVIRRHWTMLRRATRGW